MSAQPRPGRTRMPRRPRSPLVVVRIGVMLLASLGGASAYLGLLNLSVTPILAALLALGFALLARQAATSLVLDALVRRARARQAGPPRQTPDEVAAPGEARRL